MTATLRVDLDDPTPPYEQLRRQLVGMIAGGDLEVGQRLPPLRQLAGDLGLAVGTVARTYRELEGAGLVASRRGGGTRVVATPEPSVLSGTLAEDARRFARRAAGLGVDLEDAVRALRDAWS